MPSHPRKEAAGYLECPIRYVPHSIAATGRGRSVVGFTAQEKAVLLEVKGIGPTVIRRLEEIGVESLEQLGKCQCDEIAEMVASMLQTTCWKNSPQAKSAIRAAIARAKLGVK
jgi:predicted flap endonuclease-1-like 5' DNA nuclease